MRSAVLFLVFNRPDTTRQVFEAIRKAQPPRLYIAADGPRPDKTGEHEKCEEVRRIATAVDWECDVKTLFRDKNLGCKMGVSGGIDWFFEQEEEGIILEDDCLPAQSFFVFCDELLDQFRNDNRIWQISGSVFIPKVFNDLECDYLLTRYGPIWGWASWRRAWMEYDVNLRYWPQMKNSSHLKNIYPNNLERRVKATLGDRLYAGEIDTWDYQWGMVKNYNNALTIIPRYNQVVNIGFNEDATHTKKVNGNAPVKLEEMQFPISHPIFVVESVEYSAKYAQMHFGKRDFLSVVVGVIKRLLNLVK